MKRERSDKGGVREGAMKSRGGDQPQKIWIGKEKGEKDEPLNELLDQERARFCWNKMLRVDRSRAEYTPITRKGSRRKKKGGGPEGLGYLAASSRCPV